MNELENLKSTIKALSSDINIHIIINKEEISYLRDNEAEIVLKKCILYADKTILLGGKFEEYEDTYSYFDGDDDKSSGNIETYNNIEKFPPNMQNTIKKYISNYNFNKSIFCFPDLIRRSMYDDDTTEWEGRQYSFSDFKFSEEYNNPNSINLTLKDPFLKAQLIENAEINNSDISIIPLYLPLLKNVPLDILLKIRKDEPNAFKDFHMTLQKLLLKSHQASSETLIKELFQEVDYGVRSFDMHLKRIKRMKIFSSLEAIVTSSVIGLYFIVPTEITKLITTFIGINQGKDYIKNLFKYKQEYITLKENPFYVPWLCTKSI